MLYIILIFIVIAVLVYMFTRNENGNANEAKNTVLGDKIHLLSYGDNNYKSSKKRLYKEAVNSKFFYSIDIKSPQKLTNSFKESYGGVLSQKRGGGYWIWKFDIISEKLKELDDGDYLVYLDAGCTINKKGGERVSEYIEMLKKGKEDIISFQMEHTERKWTTKEVFNYLEIDINGPHALSGQYVAGIMIMKVSDKTRKIFDEGLKLLSDDPKLITDHYNDNQNSYFMDARHDQSILSLLRKKYGSIVLSDETYGNQDAPFLATRKK